MVQEVKHMPHSHGCEGTKVWDRSNRKCIALRRGDIITATERTIIREWIISPGERIPSRGVPYYTRVGEMFEVLSNDREGVNVKILFPPQNEATIEPHFKQYLKFNFEKVGHR